MEYLEYLGPGGCPDPRCECDMMEFLPIQQRICKGLTRRLKVYRKVCDRRVSFWTFTWFLSKVIKWVINESSWSNWTIFWWWSDLYTLRETNSSPLKLGFPKRKLICQPSIFRGYVTFREGIQKDALNISCIRHVEVDSQWQEKGPRIRHLVPNHQFDQW